MTRDKARLLDKLAMVYLTALGNRDHRTMAILLAAMDGDDDLSDMIYDLSWEWDKPVPDEFPAAAVDCARE